MTLIHKRTLATFIAAGILFLSGTLSPAFATYELDKNVFLSGCPFIHQDPYDFTPLLNTLKQQLKEKIDTGAKCSKPINAVYGHLNSIDLYVQSQKDPIQKEKIQSRYFEKFLLNLNAQKINLEIAGKTSTDEYALLVSNISTLEQLFRENQINLEFGKQQFQSDLELEFRRNLYQYVNNLLSTLNETIASNPQCIDQMGGWTQLLPPILSAASLAGGLGSFPTAEIIGAVTQVAAQLVIIFQHWPAKRAMNDILRTNNQAILACTYFAMKNAACSYREGVQMSKDIPAIQKLIERKYSPDLAGHYEQFFNLYEKRKIYFDIFDTIATSSSTLTVDLNLITSYLQAKAIDPKTLPPAPDVNASENEIQEWIIKLRRRGLGISDRDNMGQPISLEKQRENAIEEIKKLNSTIAAAEVLFQDKRSLVDLRHHLDARYPGLRADVKEYINYFRRFTGSLTINSCTLNEERKGPLFAIIRIFEKLDQFLSVVQVKDYSQFKACANIKDPENPAQDPTKDYSYECYVLRVRDAGLNLFVEMTHGALAEISSQSVLALGSKVYDRFIAAFDTIQNLYLEHDLISNVPLDQSFSQYKKDRDMLVEVTNNYSTYNTTGAVFRVDSAESAFRNFEKGFQKEIQKTLNNVLNEDPKKGILREQAGKTADHLCALYASSLDRLAEKSFWSKKPDHLLSRCKEEHPSIDLIGFLEYGQRQYSIDYDNECTYIDYMKELKTQELLASLYRQTQKQRPKKQEALSHLQN